MTTSLLLASTTKKLDSHVCKENVRVRTFEQETERVWIGSEGGELRVPCLVGRNQLRFVPTLTVVIARLDGKISSFRKVIVV